MSSAAKRSRKLNRTEISSEGRKGGGMLARWDFFENETQNTRRLVTATTSVGKLDDLPQPVGLSASPLPPFQTPRVPFHWSAIINYPFCVHLCSNIEALQPIMKFVLNLWGHRGDKSWPGGAVRAKYKGDRKWGGGCSSKYSSVEGGEEPDS